MASPLPYGGTTHHWHSSIGQVIPIILADFPISMAPQCLEAATCPHGTLTHLSHWVGPDGWHYGHWQGLLHLKADQALPSHMTIHGIEEPVCIIHSLKTSLCPQCHVIIDTPTCPHHSAPTLLDPPTAEQTHPPPTDTHPTGTSPLPPVTNTMMATPLVTLPPAPPLAATTPDSLAHTLAPPLAAMAQV
ncbi:hypothetical protein IWQ61_009513 [Dispira simplex]|nr:hypothetical protein IWQ61_009513 [Dispira simplex]